MTAEKLLTEAACKVAKPKAQIYYLNDGAGLRLRVRPDGSRTWILRYRLNGKEMSTGLGPYPKVGIQVARAKAVEAKQHVSKGSNPSTVKRIAKSKQIEIGETTFGLIANEWLNHNQSSWSATHYERNEGLIRRFLTPDLGRLPVESITEQMLFNVIKVIYDQGTKVSALRTRTIAGQIFSYARATHRGTKNPARDMVDNPYFKKPPVKHFAALDKDKIPELMQRLNQTGKEQILDMKTVCAIKLAIYTGLRDNAIRGAKWSEIDFQNMTWTVPSSRMKSRNAHTVPLPTQAINALNELYPLTHRDSESFIFQSNGKYGYMAENTLRLALHRLGFEVTIHGMRSLITNVLNEKSFNRDAIERQLDHQEPNQSRRAYLRTDFMQERIRIMQWFADWCEKKKNSEPKFIKLVA